MDYALWSEKMITELVSKGYEEESVRKSFEDGDVEIRAAYENQELNSAGAVFVKKLEKYDLDLELAWQRVQGRLDSDLAASYQIPKEEARQRFKRGSMKKTKILGWFRGEEVDLSVSLNF
jgi:hypothetical protein